MASKPSNKKTKKIVPIVDTNFEDRMSLSKHKTSIIMSLFKKMAQISFSNVVTFKKNKAPIRYITYQDILEGCKKSRIVYIDKKGKSSFTRENMNG